ncbi:MAG: T9SS type A sorting domain-containing protein [Flavobacteriales bacterium]|nr:T9SS type A sorting domain-containing protein [Flavobacteriales bacterium]MDG1780795.1 T9SS type A sorting domain-containing protein [Flavobacteriales bacterium]
MKKLYTLLMACALSGAAIAQFNLTLSVNMNNEMISADGVHVAGSFQGWDVAGTPMTDPDEDGVYEAVVSVEAGDYEFKFINGNDWPFEETVPDACRADLTGNTNRKVTVSEDMTYAVCFASCAACGINTVLFQVDMSAEDAVAPQGVHVAGNFQGWDPGATMLSDEDGDMIYSVAVSFDPSMLEEDMGNLIYKYVNGNDWVFPNEDIQGDCGDGGGNRIIEMVGLNAVTDAFCFNQCGSCVAPTEVTLQVDMSLQTVSPNGVHVAGSFQGWAAGDTEMLDADEDGIYEVTLMIAPGTYAYKFLNGNDWEGDDNDNESVPADCNTDGNRTLEVVAEMPMTVTYCYNQCGAECVNDPDPADITFHVDMNGEMVSADGVWLLAGFTDPQWQAGATLMSDDDLDGIYSAILNVSGSADIQYKFTNGDPYPGGTVDATVEEMYDFEANGCGVANGVGGFNRTHVRSGMAEELDVVCFNSCVACDVNVGELENLSFSAYPNPVGNVLNVVSSDFNGATNFQIINAHGALVRNEMIMMQAGNTTQIDLSGLSQGVYSISLLSETSVATRTIVKK